MPTLISESAALRQAIVARAAAEGLDSVGFTRALLPAATGERLRLSLQQGHHGSMQWMEERVPWRTNPAALWPAARTAVMVALSYGHGLDNMARLANRQRGTIASYALNRDYHDVLKGKLKRLGHWLHHQTGAEVKVFVDTAPVMEKPLAEQAGLGWQGKHTNLVSRQLGSWFFIGSLWTTLELAADEAGADHCGACRACLDICPTQAFPAPRQLDARRCISYLTIEHKGHIDRRFRRAMGNRIYGCDDCLAVCPWNKFAQAAREARLAPRPELVAPPLAELLALDDAGFRQMFAGSPVKRTGRDRFVRNCLIAAGNSGDTELVAPVAALLNDASALVRAMAVWALGQLLPNEAVAPHRTRHLAVEPDAAVRAEWIAA